jgi:hypothetical protein
MGEGGKRLYWSLSTASNLSTQHFNNYSKLKTISIKIDIGLKSGLV